MKKYQRILFAVIVALLFSVLMCACSENMSDGDAEAGRVDDHKGESVNEDKNDIAGTCWHFYFGQTNGGHFVAKFEGDGSILGFAVTNGGAVKGVYEYDAGKLHLSFYENDPSFADAAPYKYYEIDFVEYEDGYRSAEKREMMVGEDYYRITPADDSEYDEYYAAYCNDCEDSFKQLLKTGCWYSYSPQSADCEEYVFRDDGTVWIRYRDFMTGNGDYKTYLDRISEFSDDESTADVTIGGGDDACIWHYDEERNVLWSEVYDGPADAYIEIYLVHYNDVPSNETINRDRARYSFSG